MLGLSLARCIPFTALARRPAARGRARGAQGRPTVIPQEPPAITARTTPNRGDAFTHEVGDEGDVVVFDEEGQQLLVLNDIGAAVWLLLDGQRTIGSIVEVIVEALPTEVARVEADVIAFVRDLHARGVLRLSP